jgi:Ca2+-binding EF-hand superfamily protein
MYNKENKPLPNFTMLKNTFDYIDIRKDGFIDMGEWTNAFGIVSGKLDVYNNLNLSNKKKNQVALLRKWETSNNILNIYKAIAKNRKIIWDRVKDVSISGRNGLVLENNLIQVLKEIFPQFNLTNTQWRMIVDIGDKNSDNFVNFDVFIKLVEHCSNREGIPRY